MTKKEILQEILQVGGKTAGRINQKDVSDLTGITPNNLNMYVTGYYTPSDKQMNRIIDACEKIAKEKHDFVLKVKRDGRDD